MESGQGDTYQVSFLGDEEEEEENSDGQFGQIHVHIGVQVPEGNPLNFRSRTLSDSKPSGAAGNSGNGPRSRSTPSFNSWSIKTPPPITTPFRARPKLTPEGQPKEEIMGRTGWVPTLGTFTNIFITGNNYALVELGRDSMISIDGDNFGQIVVGRNSRVYIRGNHFGVIITMKGHGKDFVFIGGARDGVII